ncbi:putative beta-glucosidase 1 precursor protein [Neofusicoccum parvum]|uniref:Beta-glucosidase 1 protein n=1 Tax=Neofusicoccum parvum TaxID=310453 RepID=A0ACB5RUI3_9PEZI|nr:putative beta-glucosidase 1 precursor protein [Neofusicoccum parvum]GME49939.1 putative beta-glucosidase 1 precursor protein [Neofusicoccum parvum]
MPNDYELRGKYTPVDRDNDRLQSRVHRRNGSSTSNLRPSLDAAYLSSDDDADLDEFDPLNEQSTPLHTGKRHRSESQVGAGSDAYGSERWRGEHRGRPWARAAAACIPTRKRLWCWLPLLFILALLLLLSAGGLWAWKARPLEGQSPPWYPSPLGGADARWEESYRRAALLVGNMTLVEKVNVTTGVGWMMGLCVGNTGPVDRLGFPSLCLQDGPLGLRFADHATAWPAGVTVGATWSKELMYLRGQAHAREAKGKGVNVLLGPAMGPLGRLPAGGRNWEGFGADPVLQGLAAAWTIKGIQDEGVMATAKHLVGNEQEHFRQSFEWGTPNAISSNIDDRTLHEIYMWPFADSVRVGVASVMCSYNQVNNSYACQNSKLLNGVLKDELGFQGFVQSDWLAQRSGVASALAGLDMNMPGDGLRWQDGKSLWGPELTRAALNTSVPMERLDDMVTRIVAAWYQLGQDDKEKWPLDGPNFSSWTDEKVGLLHPGSDDRTTGEVNKHVDVQANGTHGKLARRIAAEGIVLVKNDNDTLPISRQGHSIASGFVSNKDDFKMHVGVYGEDARGNPNGRNACVDRGCNEGTLALGWGSGAVELPYLVTPQEALRREFDNDMVLLHEFPANDIPKTRLRTLEEQDLCFAFVNSDAGEGFISWEGVNGDRNDLYTQKGGDELVKTVAARCGRGESPVIVVVHAVGPVILENWVDIPNVKSVLLAHLPGQESGNAVADVIFGDVNPSGRLPYTVARDAKDYGPESGIMYYPNGVVPQQNFTEGLYIDYRYFDKNGVTPRYEFGYGLSYSRFELQHLEITVDPNKKTLLPAPRPDPKTLPAPPEYNSTLPPAKEVLFPNGFRRLKKYIYPYLTSLSGTNPAPYKAYPEEYTNKKKHSKPSEAGGGPGGNPDLYTYVANVSFTVANKSPIRGQAVPQLYISYPESWTDPDFPTVLGHGYTKQGPSDSDEKDEIKKPSSEGIINENGTLTSPFLTINTTNPHGATNSSSHKDLPPDPWDPATTAALTVIDFPVRVLRGFEKIDLAPEGEPGSEMRVSIPLTRRDLSYWDVRRQNWVMPTVGSGTREFGVWIGWSSRDLVLSGMI